MNLVGFHRRRHGQTLGWIQHDSAMNWGMIILPVLATYNGQHWDSQLYVFFSSTSRFVSSLFVVAVGLPPLEFWV